jgi:hypothetical protein
LTGKCFLSPDSKTLLAKSNPNGKEVTLMKYEKPEITLSADAVEVIQGPKIGGPADSGDPCNIAHTPAAYQSDE